MTGRSHTECSFFFFFAIYKHMLALNAKRFFVNIVKSNMCHRIGDTNFYFFCNLKKASCLVSCTLALLFFVSGWSISHIMWHSASSWTSRHGSVPLLPCLLKAVQKLPYGQWKLHRLQPTNGHEILLFKYRWIAEWKLKLMCTLCNISTVWNTSCVTGCSWNNIIWNISQLTHVSPN